MIFQPPVQFPVLVDRRWLTASVLAEIDHPVQTLFHVAFSDGFEDEFTIEEDGRVYGSGIAAIPYARSILFEIGHVTNLDPNRFYYIFQDTINNNKSNVWVIEGDDESHETIYKVYYLEYFRFALKKIADKWAVSHCPAHGKVPDEAIVRKTGFMLDALLESKSNA